MAAMASCHLCVCRSLALERLKKYTLHSCFHESRQLGFILDGQVTQAAREPNRIKWVSLLQNSSLVQWNPRSSTRFTACAEPSLTMFMTGFVTHAVHTIPAIATWSGVAGQWQHDTSSWCVLSRAVRLTYSKVTYPGDLELIL
eukprot:497331-Amphidinium_carterae.1